MISGGDKMVFGIINCFYLGNKNNQLLAFGKGYNSSSFQDCFFIHVTLIQ